MNLQIIKLTKEQREELTNTYENDKNSTFRKRCHVILLKSQKRTSKDVGAIVGLHEVSVNSWLKRYKLIGIEGLKNKPGQGRKSTFNKEEHEGKVRKEVKKERQRLKKAKEQLEQDLGKKFSLRTLKRFLKTLSASGSA
jgi:transposase